MIKNKRWEIIDEEFVSYTGGFAYLISNGECKFHVWERKEDAEKICNKLSELTEKSQDNKAMIEFLSTENTQIMNELRTRTQIQHQLEEENEQFKDKIHSVITKRINALENDYNKAVKAGMPSNSVYSEIELLEELIKELYE